MHLGKRLWRHLVFGPRKHGPREPNYFSVILTLSSTHSAHSLFPGTHGWLQFYVFISVNAIPHFKKPKKP